MEEWEGQLEQLWKCANESFIKSPLLAQTYLRRMLRVATDNDLQLANGFYWQVCSRCGMRWFSGVSATVHLEPYERIRPMARSGKVLFMSKVMKVEEIPNRVERKRLQYIVYDCHGCGKSSVFDQYPFKVTETTRPISLPAKITPPQSKPGDSRKMTQLQKILQRSKPGDSKPTALDSFLKGLDPKLGRK